VPTSMSWKVFILLAVCEAVLAWPTGAFVQQPVLTSTLAAAQQTAADARPAWSADLADIRRVATLIPGRRPLRINVLKFAESHRTKNFVVKGEAADPGTQARTVFQVVYPDGSVMVDAGMDLPMHKQIGRGADEPYFAEQAQQVDRALRGARSIIFTHEHGDHVTGVIRTPYLNELAPKTILTRQQVRTLETSPQFPDLKLTEEQAQRYRIVDYDSYMAFAPGWTLIKAAGHTPGSQMMFITLDSIPRSSAITGEMFSVVCANSQNASTPKMMPNRTRSFPTNRAPSLTCDDRGDIALSHAAVPRERPGARIY